MNNSNAKRNLEIITAFEDVIGYYREKGMYKPLEQEFQFMVIEHVLMAAVTRVAQTRDKDKKAIINRLLDYASSFDGIYGNRYIKGMSFKKKLILALNKNRLYNISALLMKLKKATR